MDNRQNPEARNITACTRSLLMETNVNRNVNHNVNRIRLTQLNTCIVNLDGEYRHECEHECQHECQHDVFTLRNIMCICSVILQNRPACVNENFLILMSYQVSCNIHTILCCYILRRNANCAVPRNPCLSLIKK